MLRRPRSTYPKWLSLALAITTVISSLTAVPAANALAPVGKNPAPAQQQPPPAGPRPAPTATKTPDPKETPTPPADEELKVTVKPDKVQTGKKLNVTIRATSGSLDGVEPEEPDASSGVSFDSVDHVSDKTIVVTVNVSEDADLGFVQLKLTKDKKAVGVAELEVIEFRPRKISRGPTPDDIDFDMDAMWNVLPYKVVKTNFGRRAADSFYAVEVYLGNNSGFDIQIVGVGFESTLGGEHQDDPNTGLPLQPILDGKGKPIRDDRGNKLIPDFDYETKQQKVGPDGKPLFKPYRSYHLPTSDHRLVRGSIEVDQLYGSRSLTLNLIGGVGTLMSGFIPFFHRANPKANFSTFSSILNGQLKEGFGIAAPDLTVSQLNRLENLVLHDGLTVLNNSQARTIVFFPRHVVELDKDERKLIDDGKTMRPLIEALGELIIVGKPIITFRNREIVATKPQPASPSPTSTPAIGAPTVTDFTRTVHAANGQIIVSGFNFVPGTQVTFTDNVPAKKVQVDTPSQLTVTIPENADTGLFKVTTPSGSVNSPAPFVAEPRIKTVAPKNAAPGTAVTIEGMNLDTVTAVNFGSVPQTTFLSKTEKKIVVNVPDKAESVISVFSPVGEAPAPAGEKFIAQPILDKLAIKQGKTDDRINITGKNLDNAQVFFGTEPGEVINPGSTSIEVKVPERAVSGPITIRTAPGVEKKTEDFTFFPKPEVLVMIVDGGTPAETVKGKTGSAVTVIGRNLKDASEVKFGGTTVTFTKSDTQITFTAPDIAASGAVTIEITTPGGTVTNNKFTYTPAPKITGFSVNNAAADETASGKADDTLVIKGENFNGVISVKFGDKDAQITDRKEKELTVKVPSGLTAGKVMIVITTPGGTVTNENFTSAP